MDNNPRMKSVFDMDCNMNMENKTIGRSVMNGTKAINIPFILFPFKGSEMIRVVKGPGAIPAARPNVMPYTRYSVVSR